MPHTFLITRKSISFTIKVATHSSASHSCSGELLTLTFFLPLSNFKVIVWLRGLPPLCRHRPSQTHQSHICFPFNRGAFMDDGNILLAVCVYVCVRVCPCVCVYSSSFKQSYLAGFIFLPPTAELPPHLWCGLVWKGARDGGEEEGVCMCVCVHAYLRVCVCVCVCKRELSFICCRQRLLLNETPLHFFLWYTNKQNWI